LQPNISWAEDTVSVDPLIMKIKASFYTPLIALVTIVSCANCSNAQSKTPAVPGSAVQRHTPNDFTTLTNPGKTSVQVVWPKNSPDSQITVTRATLEPGATSDRHTHPGEQTWIVEQGSALVLLVGNQNMQIRTGDVVRTPPGEVHGVFNDGTVPLVYLSITTPPEDMTKFYSEAKR
jgi:quercetin dioxygenase-like cupin family protein